MEYVVAALVVVIISGFAFGVPFCLGLFRQSPAPFREEDEITDDALAKVLEQWRHDHV